MNALILHRIARWRSLAGELRAGATPWEAVVAVLLAVPVAIVIGRLALDDWLSFSVAIVRAAGLGAMHAVSQLLAGIGVLVTLPMLAATTYRTIYPEGELALLRGLPIAPAQLFLLRFAPCAGMAAVALLPGFVLAGATYLRVGAGQAVAWLALGWLLVSAFGAGVLFTLAVGLGRLRSARFGRVLGDLLLAGALIAAIGVFVWLRYFVQTGDLVRGLASLSPGPRLIRRAASLFVVPAGGSDQFRLLAGAGLTALLLFAAARLDDLALRRGWGSPWTASRTASRRRVRRPRLEWLPPQTRALIAKDLPEILRSSLAIAILFVFTLGGYVGLAWMAPRPRGTGAMVPWKAMVWAAFPQIFFLWIVPAATLLDVPLEERQSIRLLRSLPVRLSHVLRVRFWVSWLPVAFLGLMLSPALAWSGVYSARTAAIVALGFVPASAACTMWALLLGRLLSPSRGSGTGAAPFMLHSLALAAPVAAVVWFSSRYGQPRTPVQIGAAAAFVFLLWLLPLPGLWRRLLGRWERE